jgi:hypothetical protein
MVSSNGGKMRLWNTESGGEPGTIGVVVETTDRRASGQYNANMEADPEWRAFLAEISSQRDPAADMGPNANQRRVTNRLAPRARGLREKQTLACPLGPVGYSSALRPAFVRGDAALNIAMQVSMPGQQYSGSEITQILLEAGFKNIR